MDSIAKHEETYFYVVAFQSKFKFYAKCELISMRFSNLILALRDVF